MPAADSCLNSLALAGGGRRGLAPTAACLRDLEPASGGGRRSLEPAAADLA